jgi:hypothetical protein
MVAPDSRKLLTAGLSITGLAFVICIACWLIIQSGRWLIVNEPHPSDLILVMAGDEDDRNYWTALELLRSGFGKSMLLEVDNSVEPDGTTEIPVAQHFVETTAADLLPDVRVCSSLNPDEIAYLRTCLQQLPVRSILIVMDEEYTRETLERYRRSLPEYAWSIAAVNHPGQFGQRWWKHRRWTKRYVEAWQSFLSFAMERGG